jgi:hypothetical protein
MLVLAVSFITQKFYFKDFVTWHLELYGEKCMKIVTTGQNFLSNYKLLVFLKEPDKFVWLFLPWDRSSN